MKYLYTFSIGVYYLGILLAFPFHRKARKFLRGRRAVFKKIEEKVKGEDNWVWFHCASLGEFEQGRPVMERFREENPQYRILLTFFSPSGFEVRENYPGADFVCYLPFDFPWNAERFLSLVRPRMAAFVKYEFWYHYLYKLHRRNIPVYGISTIIRENHPFMKWYGTQYRSVLTFFDHLFVQDLGSLKRLSELGVSRAMVTGDTRFDRVVDIAKQAKEIDTVNRFVGGSPALVAGSTWPEDEELLIRFINEADINWKYILVPHEIEESHISRILSACNIPAVRYTLAGGEDLSHSRVLVIDNIGMLSSIYRYGKLAYLGGGFGKGIHNVLEAAVYGIPVLFGPKYEKFREASQLVELEAAFPVNNYSELKENILRFASDAEHLEGSGFRAGQYVRNSTGATAKIVGKLLTSSSLK